MSDEIPPYYLDDQVGYLLRLVSQRHALIFQANTVDSRDWMKGILEATEAQHQLHVLDIPDEVCLARLKERNAGGAHPFEATEAQFRQIAKHFAPPSPDEGFNVVWHSVSDG